MSTTEKVTLTLPKNLMAEVRKIAPQRGYSKFIAEAIEFFLDAKRRQALRARLATGYQVNQDIDAAIAAEWSSLEDETWLAHVPPTEEEEPSHGRSD